MNWSCAEVIQWCKTFISEESILSQFKGQFICLIHRNARFHISSFKLNADSYVDEISRVIFYNLGVIKDDSMLLFIFFVFDFFRSSFNETKKRSSREKR